MPTYQGTIILNNEQPKIILIILSYILNIIFKQLIIYYL